MNKIKNFPFYITYWDVGCYMFKLAETYGEKSNIVKIIDDNFFDQYTNPVKYKINADELMFNMRKCIADSGFEKEIKETDKWFIEKNKGRNKINHYIPMSKRWEKD